MPLVKSREGGARFEAPSQDISQVMLVAAENFQCKIFSANFSDKEKDEASRLKLFFRRIR